MITHVILESGDAALIVNGEVVLCADPAHDRVEAVESAAEALGVALCEGLERLELATPSGDWTWEEIVTRLPDLPRAVGRRGRGERASEVMSMAPAVNPSLMFELSQDFFFEAAHRLVREVDSESSGRIHGHTYSATVVVRGSPAEGSGMVVDLQVLRSAIAEVRELLDHRCLDDVQNLGPGTLENLCSFILQAVGSRVPGVCSVRVGREKSGDWCSVRAA